MSKHFTTEGKYSKINNTDLIKQLTLRKKYIFNIKEISKDNKWIYLKGKCFELLGKRETTICLENNYKNNKRII
jgi:hypothetical protein